MNDHRQFHDEGRGVTPLVGFALGAVVGAGLALLLAPSTGAKTRERLGNAARRIGGEARDRFDQMRETATNLSGDVKSAIDAGREAFRHDAKPQEARSASRTSTSTRDSG